MEPEECIRDLEHAFPRVCHLEFDLLPKRVEISLCIIPFVDESVLLVQLLEYRIMRVLIRVLYSSDINYVLCTVTAT